MEQSEHAKEEWRKVARFVTPDMTEEEFDVAWNEFVRLKEARDMNSGTVIAWPGIAGRMVDERPRRMRRPCDSDLELAVLNLETQLGTIEAYNRLVEAAAGLRKKVDGGRAEPQNPLFAVDADGR